jgi:glycosyltransferase involved in cell wall biosynthesis
MTAQRILICLHDFSRGGTERIALGLAASWAEAGRHVTILCGSREGGLRERLDPHVKVERLNPPVRRGLLSRFRLGRAMGKRVPALRPDIVFLPGNFHLLLANALHKAEGHAAIAVKISNPPLPQAVPFASAVFRRFARGVRGFAAMNSGLAHELEHMLPGREIVTLHDPVYIRPAPARPRLSGGRNILWIGRMEAQKDPLLALETIKALGGVAHLTMLGDGALRRAVERRIRAMDLQNRVTLVGHVPEIEPHLAAADALLITSRYEGGPAVAVEALAAGVPVVSTDSSFLLHDLLQIPEAGRIVASRSPDDLASALATVCDQPRTLENLRALTVPFEPESCARAYLDWFDHLVAHG